MVAGAALRSAAHGSGPTTDAAAARCYPRHFDRLTGFRSSRKLPVRRGLTAIPFSLALLLAAGLSASAAEGA